MGDQISLSTKEDKMRSHYALLFLSCVGASAIKPYSWSTNKEYRYKYSSQVLTGIPEINNQFSGVRLTSEVRIQPKHDSTCTIKIENPKIVSYNDEDMKITGDWTPKETHGKVEEVSETIKTWLESPIIVYHKQGRVEKIETENGEPEFIVNIKKSLVSQLQHDLSKSLYSDESSNKVRRGDEEVYVPSFKTEETSILGNCETVYSVSRLPKSRVQEFEEQESHRRSRDWEKRRVDEEARLCEGKNYYEILKTKNLDNCVDRPVYHKTFSISPASEASDYPTYQSLMTRTIICGSLEDHIIRKSSSENRIYMSTAGELHSREMIDVFSTSTLSLLSVESSDNEISRPSSPKRYTSLIFEYPSYSHINAKSLKQQQQQHQQQQQQQQQQNLHAPLPDLTSSPLTFYPRTQTESELISIAIEVFSNIVKESEKMSETARFERDVSGLAAHATRVLGDLSYSGLKEVENSIKNLVGEEKYETFVEKAFYDLVAITGTNPCLMLINDKIRSGEVSKDTTYWSLIISTSLRQIRTPTELLLKKLAATMKSPMVQEDRIIRASYVLGLTNLVHRACINEQSSKREFPSQVYGKFCDKDIDVIQKELIPYLKEELKKAPRSDTNIIRLYVTALGNLGTRETTEELN